MLKVQIVGISGRAGAGKDTLAAALAEHHQLVPVAFAATLKEICAHLFDVPLQYFNDRELKNVPHKNLSLTGFLRAKPLLPALAADCQQILMRLDVPANEVHHHASTLINQLCCHLGDSQLTPRQTLQLVSDILKRIAGEDCLLKECLNTIQRINQAGRSVIVTDVRYKAEYHALHVRGGLLLGVTRDACEQHNLASEQEVDTCVKQCAVTFENNQTIDDFLKRATGYVQKWWGVDVRRAA